MIEILNVSKKFDTTLAVNNVSATIDEANVFGMVGTNGAGKSTLIRMIAGVLKPDAGQILIDGEDVYENENAKKKMFYISDEQFFFPGASVEDMRKFYADIYEDFDNDRFNMLLDKLGLNSKRTIATFSKGMKKQLSVILGICSNTKYLLCDETFDGLDPVVRQAVKKLFIGELESRKMTPIIASHNLRELEDVCDHVGLLHKGGILFSKDMDDMKLNIHRIQCVFSSDEDRKTFEESEDIVTSDSRGSMYMYTVRGSEDELIESIAKVNTIFAEVLPLSLEEIFITETEVVGYDIKNIIE
ncbi:MAG: ABC transporter ATP-binding protein [Lachnospiraceae bacterium]|nr:ABC transporter ATP-binding protein [Candidatus Colinaster equi]